MRRRRIGSAVAGPVLALVLGAVSACGKAAADDGVATASGARPSTGASADANADGAKFAQCMRDNGVDIPDPDPATGRPQFGAGGGPNRTQADRDAFQKALQACRSLLPNGGVRRTPDAAQLEQLRAFAQCMRDNGVDVPDPDPNGGGFGLRAGGGNGTGGPPNIDRNSPTFQKAMEACRSKLPQFRTDGNR